MLGGIILLLLVFGGLGIMFGYTEPKRIVQYLIWLIVGPVLIGIALNEWFGFYSSLSWVAKLLFIVALPFILLLILRTILPKSALVRSITDVLWNALVFAFTFPFRLLFRSGRLISQRERTRIRLAANQTVVGRRPPLAPPRRRLGRFDDEE